MRKSFTTAALGLSLALAAVPVIAQVPVSVESSSVEQLMADPKAKPIVEKHIPGIAEHPSYEMFKGMTLVELKPFSEGVITDDILAAIKSELATD
ncbi:hypothetical protein [Phenylobacterium sp.]|uniref:hypothetical protein n=1 Tax=Phenylobacterium sp. TaxID=1871053 RepID=UPI002B7F3338|nr:hypothetical protein [Phenylobacterium sp.]